MANYDDQHDVPPPPPGGPPGPPPPGGGYGIPHEAQNPVGGDPRVPDVRYPEAGGPPLGGNGNFDFPDGPGGRPHFNFPNVPSFHAPKYSIPTYEQAQQEPGFQFRLGQGEEALQSSAAARGVLRTGATLEDILKYGQEFASSEYQNVFNRSVQNWNIQNQRAQEQYAPLYGQYVNQFGAEQAAGLAGFQREWERYLQQYDEYKFNIGLGYPQAPQGPGGYPLQ